jgi:hypothetical protein
MSVCLTPSEGRGKIRYPILWGGVFMGVFMGVNESVKCSVGVIYPPPILFPPEEGCCNISRKHVQVNFRSAISRLPEQSVLAFLHEPCACVHILDAPESNLNLHNNHSRKPTEREVLCRARRGTWATMGTTKYTVLPSSRSRSSNPAPACIL